MRLRILIAASAGTFGALSALIQPATAQQYYARPYAPLPAHTPPQYAPLPQYGQAAQPQVAQPQYVQPQYQAYAAQPVYVAPPQPVARAQQPREAYAMQARAAAQPAPQMVVAAQPQQVQGEMGGGFIQAIFGGGRQSSRETYIAPPQPQYNAPSQTLLASTGPVTAAMPPRDYPVNPIYEMQEVEYRTTQEPGTIVIDTPNKFLYLVEPNGRALRYGIGVGRPGFTWAGTHLVSAKKEWPDWTPPKEMLERQPYLPRHMDGGPNNPLGARAMYLGSTLYRIHGSNEPWTIGHNVSSGCIRMRNQDVIDLYERVKVGAKVVVM